GDGVFVEVEDTGCGMPEEVLHQIFDPFFTTKPVGKGTGLGLSISYGIVQTHHGRLDVRSRPGEGTCFHVWLPLAQPEVKALPSDYLADTGEHAA
ncbi:MAG: hybrid sensor histidine kinase/response regulator, partial [Planctomycetes bacterium]|nr:hybrid sensor histidine kinase/response regulator [Planctomycetota bacterium]